ncbi:mitotic-spindle organizing protein 1-like isoform X1 [Ruditapes philippinarum]|uniref:mitotic-spindle organizing protein 1-like isoform X1 n=1 Tax=Ruditapes philippinarum TaxID=129788 RepID=UPI00295BBD58|nr:mitotic-spindle organizing protein 1-like isoform X1 [Ruditapes philippinarum]
MASESGKQQRSSSAKETMDVLMEMSKILNTGLDMETLATVVRLCESGVNPEALALVFNELRKESASIKEVNEKARIEKEKRSLTGLMQGNDSEAGGS